MPEEITNNRMRKFLTNEITILASIVVACFGVFGIYKNMSDRQLGIENDITFIKENHLRHIEDDMGKMKDDYDDFKEKSVEEHGEINKNLTEILTIIRVTDKYHAQE